MLSRLADFVRANPALRRCAHAAVRLIPDRPHTIQVEGLGPLRIRMRRHRHLLWERPMQSDGLTLGMFARLIRPGDTVFDIGANIGLYTRVMVQWFGAAKVIAFEPMRENLDLLRENIRLGRINDRVAVHSIALSDSEGQEALQIDDMTSGTAVLSSVSGGAASIGRQGFGLPPLVEQVSVARLDALMDREQLPPPSMMKIDTEGAEVNVLHGAVQTLRQHRPRLCIALHADDKAIGCLNLLDELGYRTFGFVREGADANEVWRELHAVDAARLSNNNIVASCEVDDVREMITPYGAKSQATT